MELLGFDQLLGRILDFVWVARKDELSMSTPDRSERSILGYVESLVRICRWRIVHVYDVIQLSSIDKEANASKDKICLPKRVKENVMRIPAMCVVFKP